jgi:hypothetical protein
MDVKLSEGTNHELQSDTLYSEQDNPSYRMASPQHSGGQNSSRRSTVKGSDDIVRWHDICSTFSQGAHVLGTWTEHGQPSQEDSQEKGALAERRMISPRL